MQVLELLRHQVQDEGEAYRFVEMLAFNAFVGNAGAHGKNSSLLLTRDGVRLSPLYDVVPTQVWGDRFDQRLAMQISGEPRSQAVTVFHWRKLAKAAGLDPDRVADRVAALAAATFDRSEEADTSAGIGGPSLGDALEIVTRNTAKLRSLA
ncbi:HipA domain-containing protein [Luteimicrobium subarcticum]|uniref:HipA domain-containing protein n=1 Tax=Luteimicrobium subarcticum TaxID=620910 RepID=UPI000C234E85|nr:HipA domain-containing protein [Luteimicrobium subarcticum]